MFYDLWLETNMFCLDGRQKYLSDELVVMMLYVILLLFAESFDQITFFYINFFF